MSFEIVIAEMATVDSVGPYEFTTSAEGNLLYNSTTNCLGRVSPQK